MKDDIEDEEYYHGMVPREDVELLLKEPGDYLVRMTDDKKNHRYILSVRGPKGVKHLVITQDNDSFSLDANNKTYDTLPALVDDLVKKDLLASLGLHFKNGINRADWELNREWVEMSQLMLGEGTFGSVRKGVLNVPGKPKTVVAVKTTKGLEDPVKTKDMMKEARLMRNFMHPHVIRMYGVVVDKDPFMIIMEYAPHGDLKSHLKNNRIDMQEKLRMCVEASWGVEYLHYKTCLHRDLAVRNCLLGKSNSVKISDFGLSREGEKYTMHTSRMMPTRWIAPEVLVSGVYSQKSDVWSFGILMWEVLSDGKEPYPELKSKDVKSKITGGEKNEAPPETPPDVAEFLNNQIWNLNVENRVSMADVVKFLENTKEPPYQNPAPRKKKKIVSISRKTTKKKRSKLR